LQERACTPRGRSDSCFRRFAENTVRGIAAISSPSPGPTSEFHLQRFSASRGGQAFPWEDRARRSPPGELQMDSLSLDPSPRGAVRPRSSFPLESRPPLPHPFPAVSISIRHSLGPCCAISLPNAFYKSPRVSNFAARTTSRASGCRDHPVPPSRARSGRGREINGSPRVC